MTKKRITGIDIIRTLAIFTVISVHYFYNFGFYDTDVYGKRMFISIFFRQFFYICVPLFMLLTGYLNGKKKLTKDYYKKIKPIITSYVFISILCILVKKIYLKKNMGILAMIVSLFDFTGCEYAWYVEMYLGLFLLIPFLNIIYDSLKDKDEKKILIILISSLTSFSSIINPLAIGDVTLNLIPDWWAFLYPTLYYFIGRYINEYRPKINKVKAIGVIVLILLIQTYLLYLYHYKTYFGWDFMNGYGNIFAVIISTLVFLILYEADIKNKFTDNVFSSIAKHSFDMYLFSYIADTFVYDLIKARIKYFHLKYFIIAVPTVFVLSYIFACLKDIIFKISEHLYTKTKNFMNKDEKCY